MNFNSSHRLTFLLIFITGLLAWSCHRPEHKEASGLTILMMASQDYGINTYILMDVFARNGWNTAVAGLDDSVNICEAARGLGFPPLAPDIILGSKTPLPPYHALVVMPGAGNYFKSAQPFYDLLNSTTALDLVRTSYQDSLPVMAMCAGVRVLAKAGIIRDKRVTGSNRFREEYSDAGATFYHMPKELQPPVVDGNLITSVNGQDFAFLSGEKIMTAMNAVQTLKDSIVGRDITPKLTVNGTGLDHQEEISAPGGNIVLSSFCTTPDGGTLYAGTLIQNGHADLLLIRMGPDRQLSWAKAYGGRKDDYATCCTQTVDGFIIGGYTYSAGAGRSDVLVLKLGSGGELIWKKITGGPGDDKIYSLVTDASGSIVAAGYTNSSGQGYEDALLVKIDPEGTLQWSKTFGGERPDVARSVCIGKGGEIVLGGSTLSAGDLTSAFFLIKTDTGGNQILNEFYENPMVNGFGFDYCNEMIAAPDGGFLLIGHSDCRNAMSVWVVKTDPAGKKEWDRFYDISNYHDFGQSICQTASGDIYITGYSKFFPGKDFVFDNSAYLIHADANGNEQSRTRLKGSGLDYIDKIGFLDGKLHLAGFRVDRKAGKIKGLTATRVIG